MPPLLDALKINFYIFFAFTIDISEISAGNLRHAACFERRRTVNPSETAYTLREPIANTAITIKTSNPSAAESAPDS